MRQGRQRKEEETGIPVQRAKIDFADLTWADFKKGASGTFPASTNSGMHPVPTKLTQTATETDNGVPCTTSKGKPDSEFTATRAVDPTAVEGVKAYMWQEKSGVKADFRKGLPGRTAKKVADCVKRFTALEAVAAKQAAKDCKAWAKDCSTAFADGNTSFDASIGDTQLEATDASECSTVFGKECRDAAIAPDELGEFTASIGASPTKACPMAPEDVQDVTAMSKADCTTDFKIDVAALHQAESDRLLAHEQLHFAISHKFAEDLRAELEKTAETLTVSAVACGKPAAVKAVRQGDLPRAELREAERVERQVLSAAAIQSMGESIIDHGRHQSSRQWVVPAGTDRCRRLVGRHRLHLFRAGARPAGARDTPTDRPAEQ